MKIFLPQETLTAIRANTHIFIDTCILLDIAALRKRGRNEFLDKLALFTQKGCVFVTVEPIAVEFYLGSTKQDLEIKKDYFNQLVTTTIPTRVLKQNIIEDLIVEYGKYARKNVHYVDLHLGAAAKQFPSSLILTRNYSDFPLKIFDCQAVFTVHLNKEARTYCFYSYNQNRKTKITS